MTTVWKYQIQLGLKKNFDEDLQEWEVEIPEDAKIISVQSQFGQPVFWAIVDTEAKMERRKFRIFATGEEIKDTRTDYEHIGTIQIDGGRWTWHLFEVLNG